MYSFLDFGNSLEAEATMILFHKMKKPILADIAREERQKISKVCAISLLFQAISFNVEAISVGSSYMLPTYIHLDGRMYAVFPSNTHKY